MQQARTYRRWEPWPFAIAALLAAMIGTSVGFLRVSLWHPDPVVSSDLLAESARYVEHAGAMQRGHALGLDLDVLSEPTPDGVAIRVQLRDASGAPLEAERITVRRERPAEGGYDVDVDVAVDGAVASADVPLPRPGRWDLLVHAERGDAVVERRVSAWR